MKKMLIAVLGICTLGAVLGISSINANASEKVVSTETIVMEDSGDWSDYTTVYTLAKKQGSGWIKNTSRTGYTVQSDGSNFRINYRGSWCRVSYSGYDAYPYKFSSSNGTWCFDM